MDDNHNIQKPVQNQETEQEQLKRLFEKFPNLEILIEKFDLELIKTNSHEHTSNL